MSFWQEVSNFEQREQDYGLAMLYNGVASAIQNNETAITSFIDTEAPQGVAALATAIEKVPEVGPFAAAFLNSEATTIDAEIEALGPSEQTLAQKAVTVLQGIAAQLQAKAAAL